MKKAEPSPQVLQNQTVTRSTGAPQRSVVGARPMRAAGPSGKEAAPSGNVWYTPTVTRNTLTIRLRRSKAEIQAKAKPNVNAWINQLIEQALGPRGAHWNQLSARPSSGEKLRSSAKVKQAAR